MEIIRVENFERMKQVVVSNACVEIFIYDDEVEIEIEDGTGSVFFPSGVLRQIADIADGKSVM